jgi:hypothetical protein
MKLKEEHFDKAEQLAAEVIDCYLSAVKRADDGDDVQVMCLTLRGPPDHLETMMSEIDKALSHITFNPEKEVLS